MENQPSLHDPEVQRRTVAMGAAAVSYLVELLDHHDEDFFPVAIRLLGDIGPSAVEAVPALCHELTKNQDESYACAALATIGSDDAIPALVDVLRRYKSESAAMALEQIGSDRAIRALCDVVGHHWGYRKGWEAAGDCLRWLRRKAAFVLLRYYQENPSEMVLDGLRWVLPAPAFIPALRQKLSPTDEATLADVLSLLNWRYQDEETPARDPNVRQYFDAEAREAFDVAYRTHLGAKAELKRSNHVFYAREILEAAGIALEVVNYFAASTTPRGTEPSSVRLFLRPKSVGQVWTIFRSMLDWRIADTEEEHQVKMEWLPDGIRLIRHCWPVGGDLDDWGDGVVMHVRVEDHVAVSAHREYHFTATAPQGKQGFIDFVETDPAWPALATAPVEGVAFSIYRDGPEPSGNESTPICRASIDKSAPWNN